MKITIKRMSVVVLFTVVLALVVAFTFVPKYLDQSSNVVVSTQTSPVTSQANELHQSLTIIDMHEDLLLWNRDPLIRHSYGHTDIPRLIEGNVSLQVFATVTKSPRGLNYESNPADSDMITPLVFFQRWPMKTWFSLKERALYQAEKLHNAQRHSHGKLTIIKTRESLTQYLENRDQLPPSTSGLLAIEGLHVLEGKLENLDILFDAGFRMMGLTHFFDNEVAGSAHGVEKAGLTDLGRQVLKRMETLGVIVDLAHLSPAAIDEVLSISTQPVVVSHTGVQGTCTGVRNLTDQQIIKIAKKDGVIGLGYWDGAICDMSPKSFAKAARYVTNLVGVNHVGLGSDFDGYVTTAFDTSELSFITQALVDEGFSTAEIKLIMGENTLRLFQEVLPSS